MTPVIASANGGPGHGASDRDVYGLDVQALMGADGATDVHLDVDTLNPRHDPPTTAKHVRLTSYDLDGKLVWVENPRNLAFESSGDAQRVSLRYDDMVHNQPVTTQVQVQTASSRRTHVLRGGANVLLRPDISIEDIDADEEIPVGAVLNVVASLAELNGDVGATTEVVLMNGSDVIDRAAEVEVGAGGTATVIFAAIFDDPGIYDLTVHAGDVEPGDYETSNNSFEFSVEVLSSLMAAPYSLSYRDMFHEFESNWEMEQARGSQTGTSRSERLDHIVRTDAFLSPDTRVQIDIFADGVHMDSIDVDDIQLDVFGSPCNEQGRAFLSLGDGETLSVDTRDSCDSAHGRVTYRRAAGESVVHSEQHHEIWGSSGGTFERRTGAEFLSATEELTTRIVVTDDKLSWGGDAAVSLQRGESFLPYDYCDAFGCFWGWDRQIVTFGMASGITSP